MPPSTDNPKSPPVTFPGPAHRRTPRISIPTPFLAIPDDRLPKAKTHPVRVTADVLATARANSAKARAAREDLDLSQEERLVAFERDHSAAIDRLARGEAVTVPARPSTTADAEAREVADRVVIQAECNEAAALAAHEDALRDATHEITSALEAEKDKAVEKARAALAVAREEMARAFAPRTLALELRALEAYAALTAAGVKDGTETVPDEAMNASPYAVGRDFVKHVPLTVRDRARRAAHAAFAVAPPVSEIAAAIDAAADALQAMASEAPSGPWTAEQLPREIAQALGLSVPPPAAPKPRETREEYRLRYERAMANREPLPLVPAHFGGLF